MDMEMGIYIIAALAVALPTFFLFASSGPTQPKDNVQTVSGDSPLKQSLDRWPSIGQRLNQQWPGEAHNRDHLWGKLVGSLEKSLLHSGNKNGLTAINLIDASFYSMLFCSILMGGFSYGFEIPVTLSVYIGGGLGLLLPYGLVKSEAQKRQQKIRQELPYLMDLLTLCVESGMDFSTALIRVGPAFKDTPLGMEVSLLVTEIRMGKSRQESLRDMSQRVGIVELSTVINSIIQSDKLGSSMGTALRIQSEDMRKHRILQAEEAGMKAPVKLTIPLVLFIFPVVFLVLFAPLAINMLQ